MSLFDSVLNSAAGIVRTANGSVSTDNDSVSTAITKEDVVKELKNILKKGKAIKIFIKFENTDLSDGDDFIQLGSDKKVYKAVYQAPLPNLDFDLEENGTIISLDILKQYIDEVAELTLKENLAKNEIDSWLNE